MDPTTTDLLIVGAGPSGLMTAITAARSGIRVHIVEKRTSRITTGHADGLMKRTLEILDSFGLAEKMLQENLGFMGDTHFWTPDSNGVLTRSKVDTSRSPIKSRFKQYGISQATMEGCMIDLLHREYGIKIERGVTPIHLRLGDSGSEYPVRVEITKSSHEGGPAIQSTIQARFLVGGDGIRSWIRQQLHIKYSEQRINRYISADIRKNCRIFTPHGWSAIIPRENNLVRIYAMLGTVDLHQPIENLQFTPADILAAAQKVWSPYKITYQHLSWHTHYFPAERLAAQWSDDTYRAFLVGDACHTHDPNTGQGMNTSTADGYNLGWKIALVARKLAIPDILATTYESERRPVPEFLIEFDRLTIGLGSPLNSVEDSAKMAGLSLEEYQKRTPPRHTFQPGLHVKYGPNSLVRNDLGKTEVAKAITLGMRMPSCEVVNHATGERVELSKYFVMDGRFKILVFCGDISLPRQRENLTSFAESFTQIVARYTPPITKEDNQRLKKGIFDTLTVYQGDRSRLEMLDLPEILLEFDDERGWNYYKVFMDDDLKKIPGKSGAYEEFGIKVEEGAVIVLRPDQHIGFIAGLDCGDDLMKYFERFLLQQRDDYRKRTEKLWYMPWDEEASHG